MIARAVRATWSRFVACASSLATSCVLLILLGLLTWLGTLEQVEHGLFEVQKKYFESFWLVHHAGPVPIPLPGANLVLTLLFVNLLVGGIVRLRKGVATLGVLVGHVGIALLLVAGFVKNDFADEGYVTLFEGQSSAAYQSHYRWELAVLERRGDGTVVEHVAPEESFSSATETAPARLASTALPFDVVATRFLANCRPRGGTTWSLEEQAPEKEAETNVAGLAVRVAGRDAVLWGASRAPMGFDVPDAKGARYAIELRHERHAMPFTLALADFRKEDHPRLAMAKSFESDVVVREAGSERALRISMNQPLRSGGLVVYQASWGPSNARPGDALFSTFAVVRNPADRWPLVACIVIAAGLLLHFARKLVRHVRASARREEVLA